MENAYLQYYSIQTGSGFKGIGPLYHNSRFVQRGSGFGSFFGALYSFFKPLLHSGLSALQNQAVKTGSEILNDLGSRPLKDILQSRGYQAKEELKSKLKRKFQEGSGLMFADIAQKKRTKRARRTKRVKRLKKKSIKVNRNKKRRQSSTKAKKARTSKKKSAKTRILDIFSNQK